MNIRKFILSLLITLVVLGVVLFLFGLFSYNTGFRGSLDDEPADKINILVAGVDKDGSRSDVNMLFSLDAKNKTVKVLSIPRDTRIQYKKGSYGKINACIGKENGDTLLIDAIKDLTGLPIHDFCKVNFQGLRNIIDILGGVEFDVPMNMDYDDPYQDLHIHLKKGKQVLNGEDAEGLLRFRKGYVTGDLGRIDVQQAFIKEMIKQKLTPKNLLKAAPVLQEISENVDTDMSVAYMIKCVWKFRDSENIEFDSYVLPGEAKMIGGASYYICDKDATKNLIFTKFDNAEDEGISANKTVSEKVID